MEKELETTVKELDRVKDQMIRLRADFDNAQKRFLREKAEHQEFATSDLLRQLLDIYDDFERALAVDPEKGGAPAFRTGVEMIARRMADFLKSNGVTEMNPVGEMFDPAQHEAVAHEATDKAPESTVLEQLRKGYVMNGKVLRHASVKVATTPLQNTEEKEEESNG